MARKPKIKNAAKGKLSVGRKVTRHSPKATVRRTATRAVGHPTSVSGWKSSSRNFYRKNLGCATLAMLVLGIITAAVVIVAAAL